MSLDKQRLALEILLDKINHLYKNLSGSETAASKLELDLLLQYTKEFQEGLQSMSDQTLVPGAAQPQKAAAPAKQETPATEPAPKPEPQPQPISAPKPEPTHEPTPKPAPAPPVAPQPVSQPAPNPAPKQASEPKIEPVTPATPTIPETVEPLPKVETTPVRQPVEAKSDTKAAVNFDLPKDPDLAEDMPISPDQLSINDRFSGASDLASTINTRNNDDLRKVIDVNERFLFIRELFKGDSESYNAALRRLNEMGSFGSAKQYIETELQAKLGWDTEDNTVRHFIDIVQKNMTP